METNHLNHINCFLISGGILSLSFSTVAAVMIQNRSSNNRSSTGRGAGVSIQQSFQGETGTVASLAADAVAMEKTRRIKIQKRRRLSTPYRRLIFGLCISDILQSIGFILGPFLIPRSSIQSSSWGWGTVSTCDLDGFLIVLGSAVSCMYSCSLCIYYFCKTVQDMSDDTFYQRWEKKIHACILVLNLPLSLAAIFTQSLNPVAHVGFCHFSRMPIGCNPYVPGDCERGHVAALFALFYIPLGLPVLCLLIFIYCTFRVVHYASGKENTSFHNRVSSCVDGDEDEENDLNASIMGENAGSGESEQGGCTSLSLQQQQQQDAQARVDHMAKLLQREAIVQLLLHLAIFVLVYGAHIGGAILRTFYVSKSAISNMHDTDSVTGGMLIVIYFVSIVRPLGGFLNVLVCVRPQILSFRLRHPDMSWKQVLMCIFFQKDRHSKVSPHCASPRDRFCCCIWSKKDDGMDISPVLRQIVEMQMSGEQEYVSRSEYGPCSSRLRETGESMSVDETHSTVESSPNFQRNRRGVEETFKVKKRDLLTQAFARALERAKEMEERGPCRQNDQQDSFVLRQNDLVTRAFAKAFERAKGIMPQQDIKIDSEGANVHDSASQIWSDRDSLSSSNLGDFQCDHDDVPMGLLGNMTDKSPSAIR